MDKWEKLKEVLVEEQEKAAYFKQFDRDITFQFILFTMEELENDN